MNVHLLGDFHRVGLSVLLHHILYPAEITSG